MIIKIDFWSEIWIIDIILYYFKIKMKLDNIIHQIKSEDKIKIKRLDLKI